MTDERPELPIDPDPATPTRGRPVHLRPVFLAAVAAGGLLGAPARYLIAEELPTPGDGWPTATFATNLVGAFLLGVLLEGLARGGPDLGWRRTVRLVAGTGFCGAVTTYSTLAVEADLLVRDARWGLAVGYGAASVLAGLLATAAGIGLAAGHDHRRSRRLAASTTGAEVPSP